MNAKRLLRIAGWITAGVITLAAGLWLLLQVQTTRSLVADALGTAASSSTTRVTVEGLDGWLPGAPRIGRITMSDTRGAWLVLSDVSVDWNPFALAWGIIDIDHATVARAEWLRRPANEESAPGTAAGLPQQLRLSRLKVRAFAIGKEVAGAEAMLALDASLDMRDPRSRATISLYLTEKQGPARIDGNLDWHPQAQTLRASLDATDRPGGILPRLMNLPADAPLNIKLVSAGPIGDWKASLKADVGRHGSVTGEATVVKRDRWHSLNARFDGRLGAIGPARLQPHIAGVWQVTLQAERSDQGAIRLNDLRVNAPTLQLDAKLEGESLRSPLRLQATTSALKQGAVSIRLRATPRRDWSDPGGSLVFDGSATHRNATVAVTGALSPDALTADLSTPGADLTAFGLKDGRATIDAQLSVSRSSDAWMFKGRSSLTGLAAGDPVFDDILGNSADLTFAVERDEAGTMLPARLGVRARRLALDAMVSGREAQPELSAAGDIAGTPLAVSARIEVLPQGDIRLHDASMALGRVALAGGLIFKSASSGLEGILNVKAANLSDMSRFVDVQLDGPASGKIQLVLQSGRQEALVTLSSPRLRVDETTFEALDIAGRVFDPFGEMTLALEAKALAADPGGLLLERLAASGKGRIAALDVNASGIHRKGVLSASGRLKADRSPIRIGLSSLRLARDGRDVRLAAPATITITKGRVDIPGIRLQAGEGTIAIRGRAGREMDLTVEPRAFPLWAIGLVTPDLPMSAAVDGRIVLKGPPAAQTSVFRLALTGLRSKDQPPTARVKLSLETTGTADRSGASLQAVLTGQGGARLQARGKIPFDTSSRIDLDLDGMLDLAIANLWLAPAGDRAGGRLAMSAKVGGTLATPTLRGTGRITDGLFRSNTSGFEMRGTEARLEGSERSLVLSGLTAQTPDGGKVTAAGSLQFDRARNFPLELSAQIADARLVSTPLTTLKASASLRVTGSVLNQPMLSGRIDIRRWDIRLPERIPRPLVPIEVHHRNAPDWISQPGDASAAGHNSAIQLKLNMEILAPREVVVRGQGLDAEFGGKAALAGSAKDPNVRGQFDLRRGSVTLLSQRISLTRGSIQFLGGTVPVLDIVGGITKNGIAATVSVRGRASEPEILLSSTPSLPQEEILSRLLFAKRTTQLSPFEGVQLAQVVGRWTGLDTGPDILERLRNVVGIDALSATSDEAGTTSVSAGSYLGPGVYVGVSEAGGGSATVDLDLTDEIKVRGEVGTTGTKIGVAAEWEY